MYLEVNGRRVYISTGGKTFDAVAPVVVFLHGSGLDHTIWERHAASFSAAHYGVLALDLPGHTNSDGPPIKSVELMADWLNLVVERAGVDNISLVGHSQGGLIALEFASRFREKTRSVSFIACGLEMPVNARLIAAANSDPANAIAMMLEWSFDSVDETGTDALSVNPATDTIQQAMRGNATVALPTDLRACANYRNGAVSAAAITCPAQVILGGKDRMVAAKAGKDLADHLTSAEIDVVADCGHMVPHEAPAKCIALLQNFIFTNNPAC